MLSTYAQDIWRCRYFWLSLVRMDLRTRYKGSALGLGWSLLQPLAMTAILTLAFQRLLHVPIYFFAPYLLCGLAFWGFVLNAALQGCVCFHQAESYIRQHPAPLAIYPLRTVLGYGFHFLLALGVVILLAAVLRGISNPLALLTLIPSAALMMLLGWALAVLGGLINVHFPDTRHLAEVVFQGLFYLTPIIYPPEATKGDGYLTLVFAYNPLTSFLRLLRDPIIYGEVPSLVTYLSASATTAAALVAAAYALRRLEHRFIHYL